MLIKPDMNFLIEKEEIQENIKCRILDGNTEDKGGLRVSRYIDADELKDLMYISCIGQDKEFIKIFENAIDECPTAEVREVKCGKWFSTKEFPNNMWHRECSECGKKVETFKRNKFCPNCGAYMRGDEE